MSYMKPSLLGSPQLSSAVVLSRIGRVDTICTAQGLYEGQRNDRCFGLSFGCLEDIGPLHRQLHSGLA